jgi:large repetitive protein
MPILGANSSGGSRPSAPVIGSATDGGTGTTASVAFTPSTYVGKGSITYTATSSPGSITATGSSPITVTGLTTGTAYTFTVQGTTNYGVTSAVSSASNSVTPATPTDFYSIVTAYGNNSSTSITLTDIPQTYTHLQLRISGTMNVGTTNSFMYRVNRTTSSTDYQVHSMYANRASSTNSFSSNETVGTTTWISTNSRTVQGPINVGDVVNAGAIITDIMDYTSTGKYITFASYAGHVDNTNASSETSFTSGLRQVVGPVTSIHIFNTGSNAIPSNVRVALYGLKG